MRWVLLVLVLVGAASGVAHAQLPTYRPSASPVVEADRPFVFVASHLGFGTPLGLVGLEVGVGHGWARASVGSGVGFGGLELAAIVRAMGRHALGVDLGVGVGISRGGAALPKIGSDPDDPDHDVRFAGGTWWLNAEAVVEIPLFGGVFTRLYGGASYAVSIACTRAHTSGTPDGPCDPTAERVLDQDRVMRFVGVAGGIRFPAPPRPRGPFSPAR